MELLHLLLQKILFCTAMAVFFALFPLASSVNDEGKALMSLKASFRNEANMLVEWDDTQNVVDFCSWSGIVCDDSSLSVVSLNLSNLGLGGEIALAIGDLKNLESLDLRGNRLTGQVPDEIGDCISLQLLDLSYNMLEGDIPFSISNLKQLEILRLRSNQLTGPIPSTLTQIPNLNTIDLATNRITGEIPRLIYWNEVMQYLDLHHNLLTGTLSPDMCQLSSLWYFNIKENNITGTIPESIGNCTSFEILDISYNQITGEIPYNIGYLQVATLSLQNNKLTGKIPEVIGLMQALAVLDLSENELVGPIPPILGNLSYTGKLYLHGNKLTGPIPPELGNMSKLSYLQLNDNELDGGIPAELGKLKQLFELNLANNKLEGPIPHNISSCTALNQLNVFRNRLNGSIPIDFSSLMSMTYLNLSSNHFSGNIPLELGRIVNLDTMDLSGNFFTGSIPSSVGDLEHLLIMNLTHNLLDGTLPAKLGSLRSVQIIDLSFNNLTGNIPEELGQLQNIMSIILNNNNLFGDIPFQLTNCLSLNSLNVSYNNLSGIVPQLRNFSRFSLESFIGNPFLCGNRLGPMCCTHAPKSRGPPKLVVLHMDMAMHTYNDIMSVTENLSDAYVIGHGASSTVYKCELKNSRPIAIKRLYNQCGHNLMEFDTELTTIGSIRHRNLVCLHGYALTPVGNLLFYDYMENGSLWDLLHGPSKKVNLDWETRLKIAVGAAQGLSYLHHDCDPRIIHRDVKSSNILLDENFDARLSDFGIAKSIPAAKTHASTCVVGTIGYIDPEYARTTRLNEKSDVYSFGIVLLELLTGRKAVDNESNLLQLIVSKAGNNTVMEAVDPEVTVTCTDLFYVRKTMQLALLCTKSHPSERPTMHEVARVLVSILPPPTAKMSTNPNLAKPVDYARFVINRGGWPGSQPQAADSHLQLADEVDSSDARWLVRFEELVSTNTE
ncbi:LRR receptor-like serine/threonine-protein kinase SIK1 isoform X2 [Impatiens glandulifera]|uniref:LRR receptor-like serine/threonine-protein kinase SIK1 isoform X2 n=1 Tax=Impatiens glandulifera TaxID=253017 RepID=UPI001FB18A01|nr:LRR receptor-like serine/threonine-protein kinase SIK1 isoform X2 [Impatiens glandulifera]